MNCPSSEMGEVYQLLNVCHANDLCACNDFTKSDNVDLASCILLQAVLSSQQDVCPDIYLNPPTVCMCLCKFYIILLVALSVNMLIPTGYMVTLSLIFTSCKV
jgi:hypothetical protein